MSNRPLSEAPVDAFFELSSHPFGIVTADGALVKVNAAWAKTFDRPDRGTLNKPVTELVLDADRARVAATLAGLFPGPKTVRFECHAQVADATMRLLSWTATTTAGDDLVYCAVEDVTRAGPLPAGGVLSDPIYKQILDAIGDMVLVKGPRSRLIWANKAFCSYYGMTNEELQGVIDAPFNEPDNTLQYIKDDTYVFETGRTLDIPGEIVTRHDGQPRSCHTVKSALHNDAGEVIMTVGVSRDVTERNQRDAELQLLSLAISATSEGILIAGAAADSPITYVNDGMERLSGHAKEEHVGVPVTQLIERLAGADAAAQIAGAMVERRAIATELPARRKDGAAFWMRLSVTPVWKDRDQLTSFVAVASDITAEREREQQERAMQRQLHLIERQRETISALSTPIMEVWDGVLTMPVIGVVDSERAATMIESLLDAVSRTQAQYVIVDLTGVELADEPLAHNLLRMVKAAGLLGSTCVLSGISPSVSKTMVALGADMRGLRTFNSLRGALTHTLQKLDPDRSKRAALIAKHPTL